MITVVGLGLCPQSVSVRGLKRTEKADLVVLKTALTPPSKPFKDKWQSLDRLFDVAQNFDELNAMIADELLKLSSGKDLVYCVDGDGFKDSSVVELAKRTEIEIIPGPFDLSLRPATGCLYLSAYDKLDLYPDPSVPVCIYNIDDANMASEVKLFLLKFFAPDAEAVLCTGKGSVTIPLEELDRQRKYSFDTAVYLSGGGNCSSFAELCRVMQRLTAPNGCPWDKAQTHESIRINLLEEAYETVEAITDRNIEGMIEELGDVLLQVVFHCDIAFRSGEFTLEDVIKGLNDKLISRHTHIFGRDKADSADGALSVWERNKMKEKHQDTFAAAVNDVPKCFPALLRAQKVVKRTEKGGWDWNSDGLVRKLIGELSGISDAELSDRLVDLLMALIYIGHSKGLNCEQLLLDRVSEVQKLYSEYEREVLADGKDVHSLLPDEKRAYYERAKLNCDKD